MLYQIIHSIAGRCRVRVPKLANDSQFAQAIQQQMVALTFVIEVRVNAAACSLVVYYQSGMAIEEAQRQILNRIWQLEHPAHTPLDETAIACAAPAEAGGDLIPLVNQWRDLGMPALSLTVALLAVPLELPVVLVGAAIAGAAMPWLRRAINSLANRQPSIDILDWVWMAAQTLRGQYAAPALKTVLVEVRRTLRGNVTEERQQQVLALLQQLNQPLSVNRNGEDCLIALTDLQLGDCLSIRSGELIPVDGRIISGGGLIDHRTVTGCETPTLHTVGDAVHATSYLVQGEICIIVERIGADTRISLISQLMQSTPVHDTHIGSQQAELVRQVVFPTLMFGGLVFATTGNVGAAISPFQLDFGSGIPISVSTVMVAALIQTMRHGVYIRHGRALEALAHLDVIVLDAALFNLDRVNRCDFSAAIATLQTQGIHIYLMTTQPLESVLPFAHSLHLAPHHILAAATLQQQVALVQGLQNQGKTVAVLGVQESRVTSIACADLSISLSPTPPLTETSADIVLLDPDLQSLVYGMAIARRTLEMVYQNTALIVIPNLFMQIGGGMILGVHPVWNVIVNNGSAFVAEFINSTRPLFDDIPPPRSVMQPVSAAIAPSPTDVPIEIKQWQPGYG
jgi:cation transport ATPase